MQHTTRPYEHTALRRRHTKTNKNRQSQYERVGKEKKNHHKIDTERRKIMKKKIRGEYTFDIAIKSVSIHTKNERIKHI